MTATLAPIDWNLLVLDAAGGASLTPAQYQKCLFILGERLGLQGDECYHFQPYNYGPFDAKVYEDAKLLEARGLARIVQTRYGWSEYAATPRGQAEAAKVKSQVPPRTAGFIERLVTWARNQTFAGIVQAVYDEFPAMKANSIF